MLNRAEEAASDAATSQKQGAVQERDFRPIRAYGTLFLLLALYTLSFLDRTVLSLLVAPLKEDLQLDDFQVSLLIGAAFSLFYSIMGLPLAYLADRYSRRTLIGVGVIFWSLMTALGGFARGYGTLFVTRMGVGLGEAALGPAAYSMIADIFPAKRIGRAMAIYTIGVPLGIALAYLLGGLVVRFVAEVGHIDIPLIGSLSAWRAVLVIVGMPGILLGLAMWLVREPPRYGLASSDQVASGTDGSEAAVGFILQRARIFLPLFVGLSLMSGVSYGVISWVPTLLLRNFGIDAADAAAPIGIVYGLGGVLGMIVGGAVADRIYTRGVANAYIRVLLFSVVSALPFFVAAPLMPSPLLVIICLTLATFFQCLQAGLPAASVQLITPNHLRARVTALYILTTSLIGLGFGPTAIGAASHYLFGEDRLDHAIVLVCVIQLPLSALLIASTLGAYRRRVEEVDG